MNQHDMTESERGCLLLERLPTEILVAILDHLLLGELLQTTLLCRQIYSLAVHTLQQRLLAVSCIPGHELILESYHPSLKLTTPYLSCRHLGTRHPTDCDSAASASADPASLGHVCQLYASFRPVVTEENRRRKFRMVWPASVGSSSSSAGGELDDEVAKQDLHLDDGVRFSQLCVAINLVTRGRFVTHYTMSEHVVRVFRGWLDHMAGSSGRAGDDDDGKISLASERLLWVDAAKTIALRFRVSPGPAERMPLLSCPGEDPATSYTLTYQELLIRSTSLLMAVEASARKELEPARNSIILSSSAST